MYKLKNGMLLKLILFVAYVFDGISLKFNVRQLARQEDPVKILDQIQSKYSDVGGGIEELKRNHEEVGELYKQFTNDIKKQIVINKKH